MTKVIAVTSSKGGVGKTTIATNIACNLADSGKRVVLCDANFSSPNVGLHFGVDKVPSTFTDVLRSSLHATDALYHHPSGIHLLLPENYSGNMIKHAHKLPQAMLDLDGEADYVILDTSSSLHDTTAVFRAADHALIVSDATAPAIIDAVRTLHHAQHHSCPVMGLVLNKAPKASEDALDKLTEPTKLPLISSIPFHSRFQKALKKHRPVSLLYPHSQLSKNFSALAQKL